jgi:high frequency lysogenization protein
MPEDASKPGKPLEQQVLALAAVVQAARLVDQIAKTGSHPREFMTPLLRSLFVFAPADVDTLYGGPAALRLGLNNLVLLLSGQDAEDNRDMVRYVLGILHLERRFAVRPRMMKEVRERLQHAQLRVEHFAQRPEDVCHNLSGIYQDTLSTLKFRIQVTGSAQLLQNDLNADKVRALLLAGVRAAFLWHQLGGRRWRLVVQRKRLLALARGMGHRLGAVPRSSGSDIRNP